MGSTTTDCISCCKSTSSWVRFLLVVSAGVVCEATCHDALSVRKSSVRNLVRGLTSSRIINSEYEHIALHRDVGETELKQGREVRNGGTLVYVDSAAVRAVEHERVLILEGTEKAERGIMPVSSQIFNSKAETRTNSNDEGAQQPIGKPGNVCIWLMLVTARLS